MCSFRISFVYCLCFLFISIMLASCATQTNVVDLEVSPYKGFTTEIDEPSVRGMLKRISPDQFDISWRFCISPDYQNIVFSGTQAGSSEKVQIWKIPATGGSPTKITSGGASDCWSPCYTPDGKYLVFCSEGGIWRVNNDGSGGKLKIPGSGSASDFDPHVSILNKIVFCSTQKSNYGKQERDLIWTCNLDGSELTQLREGKSPRWSPDGLKIAFDYGGDIWTLDSDGTNLIQLTNTPDIVEGIPSFSPDGEQIVYVSNEGKDGKSMFFDTNIWVMKSDGSQKTQMTELSSWDSWPLWDKNGIYFLSARAQKDENSRAQRIWKLEIRGYTGGAQK